MNRLIAIAIIAFSISFHNLNAQISLPYTQDFEGVTFPPTGCQFFGSLSSPTWQRSSTVGGFGTSSASMFFDNFTTDNTGNYFGIRMPSANFTGIVLPTLTFDVAYARFSANQSDRMGLYYSLNGTSGWTTVVNYQNSTLTTAPDQTTLFVPDSTQWVTKTISLPTLANLPLVRLAFENNSDHGNLMYVDNVNIFDGNPNSIKDVKDLSSEYLGFPNPANEKYYLVHSEPIQEMAVKIFDLSGKEIQHAFPFHRVTVNKFEFDFSEIPSGIYLLDAQTERGEFTRKIVVNHP